MRNIFVRYLLGATAALLLVPGLAAAKTTTVHIMYRVNLKSGNTLGPGNYKVAVLDNSTKPELAFYKNRKQVAEAPVKLVNDSRKISETEVHYNTANKGHVLTEIDLKGWNQKLMFPGASSQQAGG